MFFDSQLWLDSDCEDYFSVCDGEFQYLFTVLAFSIYIILMEWSSFIHADSSVNTPVHPSSFTKQSELDNPLFMETAPDPVSAESAIEVKKQLFELFNESFRIGHVERETKCGITELPATSPVKTPSYNTNSAKVKLKSSASSPHCCFPGLVRSLSLGEKKKTM